MRFLLTAVLLAAACSAGEPAAPSLAPPVTAIASSPAAEPPAPRPAAPPVSHSRPADIVELFEARILPTCSLNGGVCHNSNNYPDLRNVAAIADLFDLPCGLSAETSVPDVCEPPGDHLVANGVDVEILRAEAAGDSVTLTMSADLPLGVLQSVTIRRASPDLSFDASGGGVALVATGPRTVTATLTTASAAARSFFTPRLPLGDGHLRAADVNGNGVAGASMGWRQIVPGKPDKSYVVARLWDTSINPELMPRQCRSWDDEATRALGCFIEGLRTDAAGHVTNLLAPIDWSACTFEVPTGGRCGSGLTVDTIFEASCSACHGESSPAADLDLRAASLRASTVGKTSSADRARMLVVPGDSEASYLFAKIDGRAGILGAPMPKNGHLRTAEIETIRAWIDNGAH